MKTSGLRTITVLLLALALEAQSGSSQQTRKARLHPLKDAWIFKIANTFYRYDGHTTKERHPTHEELLQLQLDLSTRMQFILALHHEYSSDLSKHFDIQLDPSPKASVVMVDLVIPSPKERFAGSNIDSKTKQLRVSIDAAFLRTLFRDAVTDMVQKNKESYPSDTREIEKMPRSPDKQDQVDCSEDECVNLFMKFASEVAGGERRESADVSGRLAAAQVGSVYAGTLSFTLAHELGHYVLGHHKHACDAPNCTTFKSDETDADRYAAYLRVLEMELRELSGINWFQSGMEIDMNLDASLLFFEHTYARLGFDAQQKQSLCACDYPDQKEREAQVKKAMAEAIEQLPSIRARLNSDRARLNEVKLRQRIEEIRAKYPVVARIADYDVVNKNGRQSLFPITIGKRMGYMDANGKIVIKPEFDAAETFAEGLALVYCPRSPHGPPRTSAGRRTGLYADRCFIDENGSVRFRVNFPENESFNRRTFPPTKVKRFQEGLSLFEIRETNGHSLYGFIDRNGNRVIAADFDHAESFSESVAAVTVASKDSKASAAGFISRDGQFIIEPQFRAARSFSEGLAAVQDDISEMWGYIDKHGSYAVPPEFEHAWDFSEGLALVQQSGKREFIDKRGAVVIGGMFATAYQFTEGLAAVNVGGDTLDPPDLPDEVIGGKWGYVDTQGRMVLPPAYDWARSFSEGLAAVNVGGKWGFINKNGNVAIEPVFRDVRDFKDGLAFVDKGGELPHYVLGIPIFLGDWVYVNKLGEVVSPSSN